MPRRVGKIACTRAGVVGQTRQKVLQAACLDIGLNLFPRKHCHADA